MQPVPTIPGYDLEACLGGGPMTVVYTARDAITDTRCAVKVVRPDWDDPTTAIKLLQREARAGLAVRHPQVVGVQHAHVTKAPYFLVMDLVAGESLRRRMRRDYRLDYTTTVWTARQVAEALASLHKEGFLHGDVKPDNVLVLSDGAVVLIDLGFAHRPGENAAFLQQGYVLGTANYLAPELCELTPAKDLASDVFSLGVMLFEMLTGQLPYPSGTLTQTMKRHRCDPPADIRRYRNVPSPLLNLVESMLANRSENRPDIHAVVRQLVKMEMAILRRRHLA